jgi:dTDP-4-amino-4,6-dideoxygalactose transaminase
MNERVYLSSVHLSEHEIAQVQEAFAANCIAPLALMIGRFERMFESYTGFPHAVALNSGTAAIHLALRLLDIGLGDRVYCPSFTFIGGVAPVLYQQATPVFFDCDATSWTMDVNLLEAALKRDAARGTLPKAILPADIYGQSCDLDAILALAERYGIPVVTDSAEAVGTHYKSRHAGRGARMACFSFNGNKIITAGGGGILASDDKALIERAIFFAHQAKEPAPHYEHHTFGYNYRITSLAAAVACGQMHVIDDRVARRRLTFHHYQSTLGDIPGIGFMPEAPYGVCTHWLSAVTFEPRRTGATRETVRLALEAADIESRPVWKPMHLQPIFKNAEMHGGSVCEKLFEQGLCLPSTSSLGQNQLDRVTAIIRQVYAEEAPLGSATAFA